MLSVHLLGPVEVRRDGTPLDLGGPMQRAVIAHLALDAGKVVSVERLIDRLWGEEPLRTPLGTLQSYISRLRRVIEPDRVAGAAAQILASEAPGYVLRIPPENVDVHRFDSLVTAARAALADGRHRDALDGFDAALDLWRGPALGGAGADDLVRNIVTRLDEERAGVVDDRFEALLALGRHAEATPALQAAVEDEPLRERRAALLALALYRSGRQVEALRCLSGVRDRLLDELGLDPGPELRSLELAILAHDPTLAAPILAPVAGEPRSASAAPAPVIPVGRATEWAELDAALESAAGGRGHLVLVTGEPGIGKSTLCEAFLRDVRRRGWRTAVGRCVEAGLAPTLWPCLEVVRSMLEAADVDDAVGTDALRAMATNEQRSVVAASPVELAAQFVSLLDELGSPPWVILLDDLHWADQATLRLVALVLERLEARPLLLVGAYRPPELAPGSLLPSALGGLVRSAEVTRIDVSPFGVDDVARVIEETSGNRPADDVVSTVHVRAGGNPLFVTELARLVGERGLTQEREVPVAIRDVVRARLQQLPASSAAELEVAAVLGERFDVPIAIATSERDADDCLDALDAAVVTRVLVPDGDGFRFAHALVRDAVLAEMSTLRLARLHRRAADAIAAVRGDSLDAAEPIAHHRFAAASVSDPVDVADAAVHASDVARWRGAFDTADRLASRALETLEGATRAGRHDRVEAQALEALVATARRRADPAAIAATTDRIEAIARRSGSDAARALVVFLRWGDIDEAESLDEVASLVERAADLAATTADSYAVVVSRFVLAATAWLRGDIAAAREHAAIAIEASGATDPDERPAHVPLVLLPQVASWIAALAGDADAARVDAYRRSAAWMAQRNELDPTGSVALTFYCALVEAILDDPAGVLDVLGRLPDVDAGGYVAYERSACDVLGGWAAARLGDAEGPTHAGAAMERVEAAGERILHSCLRSFVGAAQLVVGNDAAIATLTRATEEADRRGERFWLAETTRLLAEADRKLGAGDDVDRLLDEAAELAAAQGAVLLATRIRASRADPVPAG